MEEGNILKEIITGYRNLIQHRYQYHNIIERYEIPDSIDTVTVNKVRGYFLDYIYPDYTKRVELNEAFESLDSYIKRPEKLFRMLMDSIRLFFKYGTHIPKILGTGLKALKSFRAASGFEAQLAEMAIKHNVSAPYDKTKINRLLRHLSRKEIEQFIETSESLLLVFRDKKLIQEIIEILSYLIQRMEAKKNLYSENEVKGIALGLEMLKKGDALFNQFSYNDQQLLIQLIIKIERSILDDVFQAE